MSTALRPVKLYGPLRQRFGKLHWLAVQSPHEAVRALCATVDGFAEYLLTQPGAGYRVFVGQAACPADRLHMGLGPGQDIRIVPAVAGNKSGLKMILTGLLLFYGAPMLAGAMGSSTALGGVIASYGMKIGGALMLGGVVQLLSPQRKFGVEGRADNAPSYAFNGAVNTTQQGYPVPLVFGRMMVGGAVISAGLSADELVPAATPAPAPNPQRPAEQPLYPLPDDQIP